MAEGGFRADGEVFAGRADLGYADSGLTADRQNCGTNSELRESIQPKKNHDLGLCLQNPASKACSNRNHSLNSVFMPKHRDAPPNWRKRNTAFDVRKSSSLRCD